MYSNSEIIVTSGVRYTENKIRLESDIIDPLSLLWSCIRHNKKDGGMSILKTLFLKFKWAAKTLKNI